MMFDDKQELEQFLIGTLQDAFPGDLTAMYKDTLNQSREERLEEELCLLLETCAVFQHDAIRLQGAVRRHLVGIVNRVVKDSDLPDYVETKADRDRDHGDWLYQEMKDREAEGR
jgi:hypothetical protein